MENVNGSKASGHRLAMLLLGATLALGFALGAYMLSGALVRMKQESAIHVKGLSEAKIHSNLATWSCNYWFRSEQVQAGYEGLEKSRTAIMEFLKAQKITPQEMSINSIDITTLYKTDEKGNKTNTIEGYVLSQSISVWSSDIMKIDSLAKQVSELIKTGMELRSASPTFLYTELESLKLDLLGKATRNAYERAQVLASNSGGKVGKLNSASQGVFQITPVYSTDTSDSGCYDTGSIDKAVRCVVTLEFQVEK